MLVNRSRRVGALTALLLLAASGTYLLTTEDLRDAYVCPANGEVYVFPDGPEFECRNQYYSDGWEPLCPYLERIGSSCDTLAPPPGTVAPSYCGRVEIVDGGFPRCIA